MTWKKESLRLLNSVSQKLPKSIKILSQYIHNIMNDLKHHTFVQYFPYLNKSRNQGMTVLTHRFTGFRGCPSNTGACIPYSLLSFMWINLFLRVRSLACPQNNYLKTNTNFLTYSLLSYCHVSSTKNGET